MATPNLDGAVAAATHFMALYTYARVSGDPSALAAMSGPACSTCAAIVDQVDAARNDGHRAEGYVVTVLDIAPIEIVSGESFTVELRLTEGASVVRDGAGTVVAETPDTERILNFGLRWDGDWIVEALGVEAAG